MIKCTCMNTNIIYGHVNCNLIYMKLMTDTGFIEGRNV